MWQTGRPWPGPRAPPGASSRSFSSPPSCAVRSTRSLSPCPSPTTMRSCCSWRGTSGKASSPPPCGTSRTTGPSMPISWPRSPPCSVITQAFVLRGPLRPPPGPLRRPPRPARRGARRGLRRGPPRGLGHALHGAHDRHWTSAQLPHAPHHRLPAARGPRPAARRAAAWAATADRPRLGLRPRGMELLPRHPGFRGDGGGSARRRRSPRPSRGGRGASGLRPGREPAARGSRHRGIRRVGGDRGERGHRHPAPLAVDERPPRPRAGAHRPLRLPGPPRGGRAGEGPAARGRHRGARPRSGRRAPRRRLAPRVAARGLGSVPGGRFCAQPTHRRRRAALPLWALRAGAGPLGHRPGAPLALAAGAGRRPRGGDASCPGAWATGSLRERGAIPAHAVRVWQVPPITEAARDPSSQRHRQRLREPPVRGTARARVPWRRDREPGLERAHPGRSPPVS